MHKIIDSNKPLPSNTIYKYDECFAKLLLERMLPNIFKDLELKDKPDLQNINLDLGVEVTTAIEENDLELDKLYIGLEYNLVNDRKNVIKKIESLGGKIHNGILLHPGRSRNLCNIEKCICNKLKKLNNKDYKKFSKNYLFMTDQNIILEQECTDLLNKYKLLQKEYKYQYQKIYIYRLGGELFEFDLASNSYNIYNVNNVYEISTKAREMVEIKEKE